MVLGRFAMYSGCRLFGSCARALPELVVGVADCPPEAVPVAAPAFSPGDGAGEELVPGVELGDGEESGDGPGDGSVEGLEPGVGLELGPGAGPAGTSMGADGVDAGGELGLG